MTHVFTAEERAKKKVRRVPKYPVYRLDWKIGSKVHTRHTRKKKTFLLTISGLHNVEGLSKVWFRINYSRTSKNESIVYDDVKECLQVARIFTAKNEIDNCMEGL